MVATEQPKKILVVDDEVDVTELLSYNLKQRGFVSQSVNDPKRALEVAKTFKPDLIVLDIMMPELNGLQVCRMIRQESSLKGIPIIFLSAKTEEGDRIEGFESGADDYVCKPFSPKELMLRVLVILKRAGDADGGETILQVNGINLDVEHHSVHVHNKSVELTATEFRLLRLLMQERGKVQTRETLLQKVWNYENDMETRTVDTHMRRLREKLGEEGSGLETVRGVGYRMVESRS
ncbi:MAG TPA: DNA-binding response regulator [Opitutae bacterium]|nr:DNA-binding response regulator [Opitutaceae bacterium]HCR30460.1 DNA-binding response regulator [Opitutae bacterium]|tara:strand:+ start:961 stop:1665 length:705 start_codon:yes stop_codon:yes gene_type:complete